MKAVAVAATLVCFLGLGQAHARISPQDLVGSFPLEFGDRDISNNDILTTRAHLDDLIGSVALLQTEEECLAAITALNDSMTPATTTCLQAAAALTESLGGLDDLDASDLDASCADYSASCADSSLAYVASYIDTFAACSNVTASDFAAAMQIVGVQLGVVLALSSRLMADVVCLQVDGEYCGTIIAEAQNDLEADLGDDTLDACGDAFMNTSVTCSAECNTAAEDFIDSAGCCMAGFFGVVQTLLEVTGVSQGNGDGDIVVEPRLCDQGFGSCPEMTALFNDAGIELVTTSGGGLGPVAPTAGVTLSFLVAAALLQV